MAETRVDPATGDWRIVAPERAARPVDRAGGTTPGAAKPCPFCPGNEAMTPPEVLRVPAGGPADGPGWRIRVVPNLYAITGRHEVVIESDRHDGDLRFATPGEMVDVLSAVRERYRVMAAGGAGAVVAFRNYGAAAGNSLIHPHSQLVALDDAPPGLVNRWQRARDHHARTGRCLHDDIADSARAAGCVVVDTGGVVVFQPRAASMPHETTLLPTAAAADLATASDEALTAMAGVLPGVLAALADVLNDPAYNLVVHAGPPGDAGAGHWYRWHITLYPRTTTQAGLELATGLAVNPTAPENTAPILRTAYRPRP